MPSIVNLDFFLRFNGNGLIALGRLSQAISCIENDNSIPQPGEMFEKCNMQAWLHFPQKVIIYPDEPMAAAKPIMLPEPAASLPD
jgi:hypothetical protein